MPGLAAFPVVFNSPASLPSQVIVPPAALRKLRILYYEDRSPMREMGAETQGGESAPWMQLLRCLSGVGVKTLSLSGINSIDLGQLSAIGQCLPDLEELKIMADHFEGGIDFVSDHPCPRACSSLNLSCLFL